MNNIFEKIKSGDLYSLLAVCSKEDLAPLVEFMKDKWSNALESSESYKKNNPDHTKYTDLIADEVRRYGGNTAINLTRGGHGPDYAEVVFDVCRTLDIPSKKENICENESNLLKLCLPFGWETLDQTKQEYIIKECQKKYVASGGIVSSGAGIATVVTEGIFSTAMRTVSLPLGAALVAKGVADPAFKVTIPCVLHIAYLRWKVLKYMEENNKKTQLKISNVNNVVVKRDSELVIGEEKNNPVLTMALVEISIDNPLNWQLVSASDKTGISRLNPLLQAIPSLITKENVDTTQYVVTSIPLESLTRVKGSDDEFRAIVRGTNGKITEHAKLTSADNLKSIVNATALWQIASVAVAQKHLADISQKLTEIKKTVDDIHQHLQDKRETNMTGAIDYFKQIAPSILAGELRDSYQHQIEKYEGDLLSIENHLSKDVVKLNAEIQHLKDSDMFGTAGMKLKIEEHQNKISNLYEQLLLCIQARACGWQLLLAFPQTEQTTKNRKKDIVESLSMLNVDNGIVKNTITEMDKKIRDLSATTNTALTLNTRKLELLEWQDNLIEKITRIKSEIEKNLNAVESFVQDKHKDVDFLLKIENGEIVACTNL